MSKFIQYRAFVAIVDNGSVSGAGKQLHASPSAISKQLSKLEADVGTQLIDRSTHALSVTRLGQEFYHRCKDILQHVDEAELILRNERETPSGKLSISFAPLLINTPFLALLEEFNTLYPDIKFDLSMTGQNVDLVEDNIDFAFRVGELNDSRLTAILMQKLKLCFCASPAYIKKHGKPSMANLIAKQQLIIPTFTKASIINHLLQMGDDARPKDLRHFHTTDGEYALDEMACAGLGVSLTLDISVKEYFKQGRLIQLFPRQKLPTQDLNLIYHRREYMPENMRLFKDFIKERFPIALKAM
ncbi:MAG: LysR family transcriptional regulator [Pseudomonadales bacterium]|nr:LysR family transcriptional regulator [Pseudomonadales bacterium]